MSLSFPGPLNMIKLVLKGSQHARCIMLSFVLQSSCNSFFPPKIPCPNQPQSWTCINSQGPLSINVDEKETKRCSVGIKQNVQDRDQVHHDCYDWGSAVTRMTLPSATNKPSIIVDYPVVGGETYIRSQRKDRPIFTVKSRILNIPEGAESVFLVRVVLNEVAAGSWPLSTTPGHCLRDSDGSIPFRVKFPIFIGGVYKMHLELVDDSSGCVIAGCRRAFGIATDSSSLVERPRRERPFHRRKTTPPSTTDVDQCVPLLGIGPRTQPVSQRSASPSWPLESCAGLDSSVDADRRRQDESAFQGKQELVQAGDPAANHEPLGRISRPFYGESGSGSVSADWDLEQFGASPFDGGRNYEACPGPLQPKWRNPSTSQSAPLSDMWSGVAVPVLMDSAEPVMWMAGNGPGGVMRHKSPSY